ncbi:MAG: alpha/beta fold hydrolase [Thermomicrobia bacterium]|nr:alpha/beta fold hydrolase [Thermomicrobia bacterium]
MTLRKGFLVGAGGALGGAALVAGTNAALAATTPPLWPILPGDPKRYSWRDGELGYTVRGAGTPLLLLHGITATASGYEMRHVFAPLAARYRVYCPDLIGFGLSDRPAIAYTPAIFMQMIRDFVRDVVGRSCIVVAVGLTAAYAIQLAFDHPGLFRRLVLALPTGLEQHEERTPSAQQTAVAALLAAPVVGEALFNAFIAKPGLRASLGTQFFDKSAVTDEMIAYCAAAAHQKNARFAPAALIGQQLNWPVRHAFANLTQPVMIVWGAQAMRAPVKYAQTFRHTNRRARLEILDRCGDIPHDECADAFLGCVQPWLTLPDDEARWCEPIAEQLT